MHGVTHVIEPREELAEAMPESASEILGRRNLGGRRAEAGAHVAGDVGAEFVLPIEARKHLRDEPQTAQRQKRRTAGREIEIDLLDLSADLRQRERGLAADALDVRIDADAREIGAVGDAQVRVARRRAPRRRSRGPPRAARAASSSLGPATACSISATSSAVRAIGPVTCSVSQTQSVGCVGTRPTDGRRPTSPQNDAGMRSDPPRSVPSASAIIPLASAAAPPPVEPPALFDRSHGLRVRPNTSLNVLPPAANSGQLVLPRITAPAARSRCDDERVLVRHVVGVDPRSERRAQSGHGRDVLDADGKTAQRAWIFAARQSPIEIARIVHRARIEGDDGVERAD